MFLQVKAGGEGTLGQIQGYPPPDRDRTGGIPQTGPVKCKILKKNSNKKVLLRVCKRHTACDIVCPLGGTPYSVPGSVWGEGGTPSPGLG